MARKQEFKPISLTQLFEPPEGYRGIFGIVCGYSADSEFLDTALERFTRNTRAQRAYEGRVSLLLMLDPAQPQIAHTDVPGVYHAPFGSGKSKPFRLMHAKVALLGFRHQSDAQYWRLRLIVSTGNWTRQTLEESLDLAWHMDIDSSELAGKGDTDVRQRCADIKAAWGLFEFLNKYYPTPLITKHDLVCDYSEFTKWLSEVSRKKSLPSARFVDSRQTPFLTQLADRVKHLIGGGKTPNYLAMGSGFYEGGTGGEVPSVLMAVVDSLKNAECLTRNPDIDVFVNHNACQSLATSLPAVQANNWRVRKAYQPSWFGMVERSLHAKFLFSAYERNDSIACLNSWIYLGSGNLTGPGFKMPMSAAGNLEAGVVFTPHELYWYEGREIPPECVVSNLLPIQWKEEITEPNTMHAGGEFEYGEQEFLNAPVSWFLWSDGDDLAQGGWLVVDASESVDYQVIDLSGSACGFEPGQGFRWFAGRPREVEVRWQLEYKKYSARVVVIDEFGRVAATELPRIGVEQAWQQLLSFPEMPEDEDLGQGVGDGDYEVGYGVGVRSATGSTVPAAYPIRQMMELIENIASKQIVISEAEWPRWCFRLEQILTQASECEVVEYFRKMKLNPISPLWARPFRPDFTLDDIEERQRYEGILDRVAGRWGVAGMVELGARL